MNKEPHDTQRTDNINMIRSSEHVDIFIYIFITAVGAVGTSFVAGGTISANKQKGSAINKRHI